MFNNEIILLKKDKFIRDYTEFAKETSLLFE